MDVERIKQQTEKLGIFAGTAPMIAKGLDATIVAFGPEGSSLTFLEKVRAIANAAIPGWKRPIPNLWENLWEEAGAGLRLGVGGAIFKGFIKDNLGVKIPLDAEIDKFLMGLTVGGGINVMLDPSDTPGITRGGRTVDVPAARFYS